MTENSIFDDMTPRYVPNRLICSQHMAYSIVTRFVAHPAGSHKYSPIKNELSAVECILACGCSRWFGCSNAYINSELKMVIVGVDSRDEVRTKWSVVPKDRRI